MSIYEENAEVDMDTNEHYTALQVKKNDDGVSCMPVIAP